MQAVDPHSVKGGLITRTLSHVHNLTRLGTIVIGIITGACGSSDELPTIRSPRETGHLSDRGPLEPLSSSDHTILSELIRSRMKGDRTGVKGGPTLLLVSDVTLKSCPDQPKPEYVPPDAIRYDPATYLQCVPLNAGEYLDRHPVWGAQLSSFFKDGTREARKIRPRLGRDVVLISLTDRFGTQPGRRFSLSELLQRDPRGSQFVQFSAPVYPSLREALVFYRFPDSGGGFVYLVRRDEQWSIRGSDGWTE